MLIMNYGCERSTAHWAERTAMKYCIMQHPDDTNNSRQLTNETAFFSQELLKIVSPLLLISYLVHQSKDWPSSCKIIYEIWMHTSLNAVKPESNGKVSLIFDP